MTFLLSTLLALWLVGAAFKILKGILQILIGCLAFVFGSLLCALTVALDMFIRLLRTAVG